MRILTSCWHIREKIWRECLEASLVFVVFQDGKFNTIYDE